MTTEEEKGVEKTPEEELFAAAVRGNLQWPQSFLGIRYIVGHKLVELALANKITFLEFVSARPSPQQINEVRQRAIAAHQAHGISVESERISSNVLRRILGLSYVHSLFLIRDFSNQFLECKESESVLQGGISLFEPYNDWELEEAGRSLDGFQNLFDSNEELRDALRIFFALLHEALNDATIKEHLERYRVALANDHGNHEREVDVIKAVAEFVALRYSQQKNHPTKDQIMKLLLSF